MGLPVNDSRLWNMCAAADWGWLRWDMSKAWASQSGYMHRLNSRQLWGLFCYKLGGSEAPLHSGLSAQHPSEGGPMREAGARLTEAG